MSAQLKYGDKVPSSYPIERVEEMVALNKVCTFHDPLDAATRLEDALFMERNSESFFSEVMIHRHGSVLRLSIYRNHFPEPLCSLVMSEDDMKKLAVLCSEFDTA